MKGFWGVYSLASSISSDLFPGIQKLKSDFPKNDLFSSDLVFLQSLEDSKSLAFADFWIKTKHEDLKGYQVKNTLKQAILSDKIPIRLNLNINWGLGSFHCLSQQEPFVQ